MGQILKIRNLNLYVGRYERGSRPGGNKPSWTAEDLLHEILPILALRNREVNDGCALVWKSTRNIRIAADATLNSLRAWQAYRPYASRDICDQAADLLPDIIESFQEKLVDLKVTSLDRATVAGDERRYSRFLVAMADAVGKLSHLKPGNRPMLGSKIMHFLLPEFFPVWDTAWVEKALNQEKRALSQLGCWFPARIEATLAKRKYADAAIVYARYVALMLRDLDETSGREWKKLARVFARRAKVDQVVVDYHFHDLTPTLFEVCLLGKHSR